MPEIAYRDGRFLADGRPLFVAGVDYQYYRDRADRWAARLAQLRAARCNVVTFYVPWRHHAVAGGPDAGFDFTGATRPNRNLVRFVELAAAAGFLAIAKPGPFVHSELNVGGLPDAVSPSFADGIEPVRDHRGAPMRWGYDGAELPAPLDPTFDRLALAWLAAVGDVLRPFVAPDGPVIGVQLNDETLYCTANSPPWSFGYDEPDLALHREIVAAAGLDPDREPPPRLGEPVDDVHAAARLVRWADYQWRIRRDAFARYRRALALDLPALSNLAGITPPIEENVPGGGVDEGPEVPASHARLYADWWLAQNRVDRDRDVAEYGFVSWLGVAAYGIDDLRTVSVDEAPAENRVFDRWVATAARRRGINLEENWGFARLYHPFSKEPIVPFFQTLVSVAAGATGWVVFCGVQHDHWDDDLDRITRRQQPTFPSDAPIAPDGATNPLYDAMTLLGRWFEREGEALLRTEPTVDATWLVYPPWAAISGWVAGDRIGEHETPRCGVDGLEPFTSALLRAGLFPGVAELDAFEPDELAARGTLALRLGFAMDAAVQERLLAVARAGATILACGAPPEIDLAGAPCRSLRDALVIGGEAAIGSGRIVHRAENLFAAPERLIATLAALGVAPRHRVGHRDLRAFVHTAPGGDDAFIFFFHLGRSDGVETFVEIIDGPRLELTVGPKTCGVAHVRAGRLVSVLVKGRNEVEGIESAVRVAIGAEEVAGTGDLLRFDIR